jgi:hypothetical protein
VKKTALKGEFLKHKTHIMANQKFQKENLYYLIPFALYMFMQLSAWQVFHNFYSQNVAAAPAGAHAAGFLFFLGSLGWTFLVAKDSNYVSKSDTANVVIIGLSMVLSLLCYAGFVFNVA